MHLTRYLPTSPPDPNSWSEDFWSAQLHLWKVGLSYFFLWSERAPLLSPVLSHIHLIFLFLLLLNLFNLSETSASFQCLDLQGPHLRPFQDKSTVSSQDNKCSLPVLSFSYWTPSSKNPWWMDSQLKFLAPTRLRKLHDHHNSAFTTRQSWLTQTNSFLNQIWTLNPAPQSSQRSSQTYTNPPGAL